MSRHRNSESDQIAWLKAQIADAAEKIGALTRLKDHYESALELLLPNSAPRSKQRQAVRPSMAVPAKPAPPPPQVSTQNQFYGLAWHEAAVKQLRDAGKSMSAQALWEALRSGGFQAASKNPVHSVDWALKKRSRKQGDVYLDADGLWAALPPNTEGKNEHGTKTKLGMGLARARGVRMGRRGMTPIESIVKAHEFRNSGMTIAAACRAAGVNAPTYNYYRNHYDLDLWKPGMDLDSIRQDTAFDGAVTH